jgi:MSHA pilin protein MshD
MTAPPDNQLGLTLVELILSMVIISIALVGIFSVMNLTIKHSADPMVQHQAVAIAESYLEEILLQTYSGGSSTQRADYDDVDDYHGLSDTGVHDQNGNSITGLSQYTITVSVSAPVTLTDGVNAKKITVTVADPNSTSINLVGYKTDY